ncbi:hypothetical protein AC481_03730 [miscellaneous Crenarchaeota group archaeon SMTZ-80]|nr:MAG: hypothetical protein AC481_03730 [miscellaneous Crenarchaeota group archaeon SMTZ-80]
MSKGSLGLLAICGMVAPIWFIIMWIFSGAMYIGYNHVTQYISELGAVGSPVAWFFNPLGLEVYGLLIIAFSYGLYRGIKESLVGPALLGISGVGVILVGIFPMPLPAHNLAFLILAISVILSCFTFPVCFKRDVRWKSLQKYTLLTGVLALIFLFLLLLVLRLGSVD